MRTIFAVAIIGFLTVATAKAEENEYYNGENLSVKSWMPAEVKAALPLIRKAWENGKPPCNKCTKNGLWIETTKSFDAVEVNISQNGRGVWMHIEGPKNAVGYLHAFDGTRREWRFRQGNWTQTK